MKHMSILDTTPTEVKNLEWRATGIAIGELANEWSGRTDIVATMVEETHTGAAALFSPKTAEVHISTKLALPNVNPSSVGDFRDKAVQYEFPQTTGAVLHEALHARYSTWDIRKAQEDLTPSQFEALILLEESRIEAHGARDLPWGKIFLKSCAMDLVIQDSESVFEEEKTVELAGKMVGLVHARVIAGILDDSDVGKLMQLINTTLGEEVVEQLQEVIVKVQEHRHHRDATDLYKLAIAWVKILDKEMSNRGELSKEKSEAMQREFVNKARNAMKEAQESAQINTASQMHDQQDKERHEELVKQLQADAEEQVKNNDAAKQVFSRSGNGISGSVLIQERLPSSQERIAAVAVAQMLEKAKYRERSLVESNSSTPPGRLRTRALVQANAMKSRGVFENTEPWRKKSRKHTDQPNLKIGVMVDVSGSMGHAMEAMATTAWVMSEAGKRIQARTAMVYFGSSVFPTLKPGQHLDKVRVFSAHDSTEEFDEAFRAIDGALDMLHGSDARLLVVVSDGYYRPDQKERAMHWVKKCDAAGVAVLWLPFSDIYAAKRITRDSNSAQVLDIGSNPESVAKFIGKAASTALSKVGARR